MESKTCALKRSLFTPYELKTLHLLKEKGEMTRQEIIELHKATEPGIYKSIEKMVNSGAIDKLDNPSSKNNHIIKITELGISCLKCQMNWVSKSEYQYPTWCFLYK